MNFTAVENLSNPLFSETAKGEYLRAIPLHTIHFRDNELYETWKQNIITNDDISSFMLYGGKDILKELGPISREDYDYYENL